MERLNALDSRMKRLEEVIMAEGGAQEDAMNDQYAVRQLVYFMTVHALFLSFTFLLNSMKESAC